jgi:NAD(P)-dependent dehydrogenase (short-subunit alcohol dehydrogenase family)
MNVLEGKAVVITGAGRGLGRAFARHAVAEGARVVVNDVDAAPAGEVAAELGDRAVVSTHSVADPAQAAALVDQCVAEFGRIDGLVNNAALNYKAPPWSDDPARMRNLIEVNVLGALYCGTAAASRMHARGSGVILNICSGSIIGQRNAAAYSASKGAVASMTFSWATDLAEHGIRVNALAPLALTRMVLDDPQAKAAYGANPPPEDIAPMATYLLSDLSAPMTGQLVRSTGNKIHIVRQPAVKHPVLQRDRWEVTDIAAAFEQELSGALEPPPRVRWTL